MGVRRGPQHEASLPLRSRRTLRPRRHAFGRPRRTPAAPPRPSRKGDIIRVDDVDKLKPFLPPEFWDNRDFFFYEGMQLEIGPADRDYTPSAAYEAASRRFKGQKRGSVRTAASRTSPPVVPFDERRDRLQRRSERRHEDHVELRRTAGTAAAAAHGSSTPTGIAASSSRSTTRATGQGVIQLSHRVEAQPARQRQKGDVFRGEKRKNASGPIRGRRALRRPRHHAAELPLQDVRRPRAEAKNDDTWVYVPTLRRVRRISTAQRTDAVSGTDFTMDDLFSFNGIVPSTSGPAWARSEILAPMNTQKGYPYEKDHNFGPYGLSFADDRWELRDAVKVRMTPKNADHPYHHKDIYIDKQTMRRATPSPTTRRGALEDHLAQQALERGRELTGEFYPGLGRGARAPRSLTRRERHHRQRADRHRQPHRVLESERHSHGKQGQDPPLHRRRPAHQGPLTRPPLRSPRGVRPSSAHPPSRDRDARC